MVTDGYEAVRQANAQFAAVDAACKSAKKRYEALRAKRKVAREAVARAYAGCATYRNLPK